MPYERCRAVFERIGQCWVGSSSIWRQTQKHGQRRQQQVEPHREQVSVERTVLPDGRHDHHQRKAVSMEGGRVNIREQGWRELKVGTVFDVEIRLERNPKTQALDEMAQGVNPHYTAVLGPKEDFTPALWALAVDHDLPTARDRAVVGEGAAWIWNVAEEVCPDGRQMVDWFHAVQPLADAATAIDPDERDAKKCQRWLKTYQEHLYLGRIHDIIATLHKRGRDDLALYFERHQRRIQDLEFREEGFPMGPVRLKAA
jgi:hypothetical protein